MGAEAEGATVSIVIASAEEVALFPAESVSVTVMLQTPSDKVPRVQEIDKTLHVTLVDPVFAAVIVAVPVNAPEVLIVGVLSLVMSSLFERPRSEADARSGVAGVEIAILLITTFASTVLVSELTPPND